MERLTILHTIAGLKDRAGGVARSVPGLCEALARESIRAVLLSQRPWGGSQALLLPDPSLVETRLLGGFDCERLRASYTPFLARRVAAAIGNVGAHILHDHGLWLQMNHAAAIASSDRAIPRVVSPRGMLDQWALNYRGLKKRLAWRAYQRHDLESATAFCATSILEAEGIRALGLKQPVAVIPNGVTIPERNAEHNARPQRSALFLSRLHPKKGLLDLIAAWSIVRPSGWRLVIAGPDEDGFGRIVEDAVRQNGISNDVTFTGAVAGVRKSTLFGSASVFVLPSYSENFGIVVAEALSHGVPVIATTGTPWSQLRSQRCGWWIEPGIQPLTQALQEATELSDSEREIMGARGLEMVKRDYSWAAIARRHAAFYEWLLGRAGAPADLVR